MCSTRDDAALPTPGFPIRASAGHRPFSASPRLIAAVHALLRLLVPRHPPCALNILTVISVGSPEGLHPVIPVSLATVQFSRSAKRRRAVEAWALAPDTDDNAGLSKLNSMQPPRLRHEAEGCAACQIRSTFWGRARSRRAPRSSEAQTAILPALGALIGLPRKEVIQPQLPLRLPCYDFTPVASPTFDGSLPCGLGHRLRVLLTPMV